MSIYRASQTADIFAGAHFAAEQVEAAAYAENGQAGTGDNAGGMVREYTLVGSVLRLDSIADVADFACEMYDVGNDLGMISNILNRMVEDGDRATRYAGELADALQDRGIYYTFDALEGCDELVELIADEGYALVRFLEPSVGEHAHHICTTYRLIDASGVELA